MKPEAQSRRVFGITRAKGKMFELSLPESAHLRVPDGVTPSSLLLLAIATLGDTAAAVNEGHALGSDDETDLDFAASYFDALLASRFQPGIDSDVYLLAASAYYLARRPGSSSVMSSRLVSFPPQSAIESGLRWVLQGGSARFEQLNGWGAELVNSFVVQADAHFTTGADPSAAVELATAIRQAAYRGSSARDLLFADLILAVLLRKLEASSWINLPLLSGLSSGDWRPAIEGAHFPKELWPAQLELGRRGLFAGTSGVVQMPTSAGKTKSLEMILRAVFLGRRGSLAIIVAPFRALSHEIATSMRLAFADDSRIRVNELSDALQEDFAQELGEFFGISLADDSKLNVIVVTPEKLQYVIRQSPDVVPLIDLLVYDEAHQFDSGARGITYELLATTLRAGLKDETQVIAISAVISNADDLRLWMLGESSVVVDGSGLAPTARAVAFATGMEQRGQLQFYEGLNLEAPDYFVPRAIDVQDLELRGKESKRRVFPSQGEDDVADDTSLYLGLRLAPQGAVALYCGTKPTAGKIVRRAVEAYDRGLGLEPPSDFSDAHEVEALTKLLSMHFGAASQLANAASRGIFVHHGNTPNGLRLSIEYAMQKELVRFVVCTSTLAQGVNLPIRYLIVSGTSQGTRPTTVRDFQNLLGRAGRAGMHTEGLIVFGDPRVFDRRESNPQNFRRSRRLINPDNAENVGSSLLELVGRFSPASGAAELSPADVTELLFEEEAVQQAFIAQYPPVGAVLAERRKLLSALESHLMANRSGATLDEFRQHAALLCEQTFAYFLANDDERIALRLLFIRVAEAVTALVENPERQAEYGRTLLGADRADTIFRLVEEHRSDLVSATDVAEAFDAMWPILEATFQDRLTPQVEPATGPELLARAWIAGSSYGEIFDLTTENEVTKPHGTRRRRLTNDDVIDYLHQTLAFDASLVTAAVCQFLGEDVAGEYSALGRFLKSLKYGVPDALAISAHERGFADRAIATAIADSLRRAGYEDDDAIAGIRSQSELIRGLLSELPSYFEVVLETVLTTD
jgi:POLQ-like helicase